MGRDDLGATQPGRTAGYGQALGHDARRGSVPCRAEGTQERWLVMGIRVASR